MSVEPLVLVLLTLAVYRVTCLIVLEEGPFGVLAWIRGHIDPDQRSWAGRGVRCVYCVSFWLSLIVLLFGGSWLEWLAVAGAVHLLISIVSGRSSV